MADDDTKDDTPGTGDETPDPAEDAEGAGEDGDEEPKPAKGLKGMSKKLIIAGAAVLLVGGGGAALYFTGALDSLFGGSRRASVELPGPSVYYEFPELLVDLKTGRCRSPFIKLRVVAEVSEPDLNRLQEVEPQILDSFQAFLRDHERADLVGKAGTATLRRGFLKIVDRALNPARARNVLFREILLQ